MLSLSLPLLSQTHLRGVFVCAPRLNFTHIPDTPYLGLADKHFEFQHYSKEKQRFYCLVLFIKLIKSQRAYLVLSRHCKRYNYKYESHKITKYFRRFPLPIRKGNNYQIPLVADQFIYEANTYIVHTPPYSTFICVVCISQSRNNIAYLLYIDLYARLEVYRQSFDIHTLIFVFKVSDICF